MSGEPWSTIDDSIKPRELRVRNERIAQLEDENSRLKEALRPFARLAKLISPETNEDSNFATYRRDRVTVGDLRRAKKALEKR